MQKAIDAALVEAMVESHRPTRRPPPDWRAVVGAWIMLHGGTTVVKVSLNGTRYDMRIKAGHMASLQLESSSDVAYLLYLNANYNTVMEAYQATHAALVDLHSQLPPHQENAAHLDLAVAALSAAAFAAGGYVVSQSDAIVRAETAMGVKPKRWL